MTQLLSTEKFILAISRGKKQKDLYVLWFSKGFAQARSQVLKCGGQNTVLEGKIFVFITCLKQIFRGTKIGGSPPRMPPATGLGLSLYCV